MDAMVYKEASLSHVSNDVNKIEKVSLFQWLIIPIKKKIKKKKYTK